jgi:hypothetical protein
MSCLFLSCLVLPCLVLSYLILPYLVLSCFLSCLSFLVLWTSKLWSFASCLVGCYPFPPFADSLCLVRVLFALGTFVPRVSSTATVSVPTGTPAHEVVTVWSDYAQSPGASWVRVHFDENTSLSPSDVNGCTLRLTSSLDGAMQYLNDISLPQVRWSLLSVFLWC